MKTKKFIGIVLAALMLTVMTMLSAFAESTDGIKVVEYLNAPSQYTNNAAYGININGTLEGKLASLGNFGGYVIYEFDEPVMNSDNHAYGVDFIVSGNAFNAALTTQEPGQVWVSQDGVNWYALAGSEHYEDSTVWDYSLTYNRTEERKCTFTDSLGDSGTVSPAPYPLAENYPTVMIPENSLTLSGILLAKQRVGSTNNGILTSFGYVDTHKNSGSSAPSDPYVENHIENGRDGQFDISWAVDKNGIGVELDSIKYVKVQTAAFIDSAAFGEKSTEVSSIKRADASDSSYETTTAPASITVDGKEIALSESGCCEAEVEGEFDVVVDSTAKVYINNAYGSTRHFEAQTEKGIIRVIVQEEDKLPLIYYINTGKGAGVTAVSVSETEKELETGDTFELTASADNGEAVSWSSSDDKVAVVDENGKVTAVAPGEANIIATSVSGRYAKCRVTVSAPAQPVNAAVTFSVSSKNISVEKYEIEVSSDIAERYGFETAKKDHNGVKVEGVTVFDVIVAAHEKMYGEAFSENTADYLVMTSGFITKAFGQKAAASGFIVNGIMPNDGIYNPAYYGFTGYSCDTARVSDGDDVTYYFYRDTTYYSDYYAWFDSSEYTVSSGETLSVALSGYCAMYYGMNEWQTILDNYAEKLEGISIYTDYNGEKVLLGVTDKNGEAKLDFPGEGSFVIYAEGETTDESPVITPYAAVTVTAAEDGPDDGGNEKPLTLLQRIKNFFRMIKEWFMRLFGIA